MAKRKIIKIDEEKCNGCGLCIPHCAEGAIRIIDGKARLVSDIFCDGLGACLGHCPQGAIRIIERKADAFDEAKAHAHRRVSTGCPSSQALAFAAAPSESHLANWPLQLSLVPVNAPYLEGADVLLAADCVAFCLPDFHERLLRGKILIIACPKLDDTQIYAEKLTQMVTVHKIKSLTIAHMEVPCCFGLKMLIEEALERSKKDIPIKEIIVSRNGRVIKEGRS